MHRRLWHKVCNAVTSSCFWREVRSKLRNPSRTGGFATLVVTRFINLFISPFHAKIPTLQGSYSANYYDKGQHSRQMPTTSSRPFRPHATLDSCWGEATAKLLLPYSYISQGRGQNQQQDHPPRRLVMQIRSIRLKCTRWSHEANSTVFRGASITMVKRRTSFPPSLRPHHEAQAAESDKRR